MGIISSNKSIGSVTSISCDGELQVSIGITAAPDIDSNPTDVVLLLDRSGSMEGQPLADMKTGVHTFVDILAGATGGATGEIGSGSRIGIVSFADTAEADTGLITSINDLDMAVAVLTAGGLTNHAAAFQEAMIMLSGSINNKVIVMFTDGETTTGPDPSSIAAAARSAGITIYCVGLIGSDGIDVNALNDWATDPDITHVAVATTSLELDRVFADLAANIAVPGATNVVIDEFINSDFVIIGTPSASVGNISLLTSGHFRWTIDELGMTSTQSAVVTFTIKHTAFTTGLKPINVSISFSDDQGSVVIFADPWVFVNCDSTIPADVCPTPIDIPIAGCVDFVEFSAGDLELEDTGRILQLDINLRNVCPGKKVALAVVLTELDANGMPQRTDLKTFLLPAHTLPRCSDVLVTCIRFILPGNGEPLCEEQTVRAQFFAHYIDNGFQCCQGI